jgi:hypothetical protein
MDGKSGEIIDLRTNLKHAPALVLGGTGLRRPPALDDGRLTEMAAMMSALHDAA